MHANSVQGEKETHTIESFLTHMHGTKEKRWFRAEGKKVRKRREKTASNTLRSCLT